MLVLKKFLWCLSLRFGSVLLGYCMLLYGFAHVLYMVLEYGQLCERMMVVWFLQAQTTIIAAVLLLSVAHTPESLCFLLPIQIVVKLLSVIFELLFYLMVASSPIKHDFLVAYSFFSIAGSFYLILVVYSFYQKTYDTV